MFRKNLSLVLGGVLVVCGTLTVGVYSLFVHGVAERALYLNNLGPLITKKIPENGNISITHKASTPEMVTPTETETIIRKPLSDEVPSKMISDTEKNERGTRALSSQSASVITRQSTTPAPAPEHTELFRASDMRTAHNALRTKVGVPLLVWSEALAVSAQSWADELSREGCAFRHDERSPYGENLFMMSIEGGDGTLMNDPSYTVSQWSDEARYYTYKTNTCAQGHQCGHYTQLIWGSTTAVGCAVKVCMENGTQHDIWVCRYDPPGNVRGLRPY